MKKENMPSESSVSKKVSFLSYFKDVFVQASIGSELAAGISTALVSIFAILGGIKLISNAISQNTSLFFILAAFALLISGIITVIATFYTRFPLIFTLSIGVNTFLTAFLISRFNLDWSSALGLLLLESVVFSLIVLSPFPKKFLSKMPDFFHVAWPACIGGILVSVALISGKVIEFQGSAGITIFNLSKPEVFLFFVGSITAFLLFRQKKFHFYGFIPLLMALYAMIFPTVSGVNMNKGIIMGGAFFVGWLLLHSILVDAKKRKSLVISLSTLVLGLAIAIVFSDKIPDAILPAPFKWLGDTGVFYFPSLTYLKEILGFPFVTLGSIFSQFNVLWSVFLSLLIFHFITSWALISTLSNPMRENFNSIQAHDAAEKRYFAIEGASNMISSHLCLGGGTYSIGSLFVYIFGGKTILASLSCGVFMIIAVVFLPFAHRYLNLFTVSPLLLIGGAWLIHRSVKFWLEKRENLLPILAVFI